MEHIVKRILQDRPIAYHPDIARVCGGVKAGVFFSQLLYWSSRGSREDGYIWKTQQEWEEETALTRYEQEGARKNLKEKGFLEEVLMGVPAKLYYRIKFDAFYKALESSYSEDVIDPHSRLQKTPILECDSTASKEAENPQTITEITTEITTEILSPSDLPENEDEMPVDKNGKPLTNQQLMVGILCLVFNTDPELTGSRYARLAKELLKKYTIEQVKTWYAPGGWWYLHDRRGQNGELPNEYSLRQTIKQAHDLELNPPKIEINPETSELESYFEDLTGLIAPPPGVSRQQEWIRPCESFLDKAGDLDKAKKLMDDSFEIIRSSDKYKFSNPLSLLRTAMNLHAENGNGSTARQIEDEVGGYYV